VRTTRRRLLAAATLALAGCTGRASADRFRARVEERIEIRALSETTDAWVLEYLTTATTSEAVRHEARDIALAYAATVPDGDHRLDVTAIADAVDARTASWIAEGSWARAHAAGNLLTEAYLDRIAARTDDFD
jgi:hypothetical protein